MFVYYPMNLHICQPFHHIDTMYTKASFLLPKCKPFSPLSSRTSKAFHSQLTIKQCGIETCYTDALDVFLRALDVPHQLGIVHASVRQYLHRMVVCLEEDVLPYVPVAVEHLLKKSEARDLHKFMPLINQIISKFKVRREE